MPFYIVDRFSTPWEAHLTRALLESENIDAFLFDEHLIWNNWFHSTAYGYVKLLVPIQQREAAEALLSDMRRGVLQAALYAELELPMPTCPACGATEFSPVITASDRAAQFLTAAMLGFFHPIAWREMKCSSCGARMAQGN